MSKREDTLAESYLKLIDASFSMHSEFVEELVVAGSYKIDELNFTLDGLKIHINKTKNVDPRIATVIIERKDMNVDTSTSYRNDGKDHLDIQVRMQNEDTKAGRHAYNADEIYTPTANKNHLRELASILLNEAPVVLQRPLM